MTTIKTNPRAPMSRMDVARFCVIMRRSLTNSHTKRQRQRLEEMQAEMDYIFETISKNNNEYIDKNGLQWLCKPFFLS